MSERNLTPIVLVYVGVQSLYLKGHKEPQVVHAYRTVEGDDWKDGTLAGDDGIWQKPLFTGRPGTVYALQRDADKPGVSVITNTAKWLGTWPDKALVTLWQIEHDAVRVEIDAKREREKAGRRNYGYEALDPFREAYWKASIRERAALLANVIGYITKHSLDSSKG